ncbi:MAG TPA: hypothetical protein VEB21_16075 [Terriglobales bacterium]|nr:hypothetical protein [Terriglobales bacterium]
MQWNVRIGLALTFLAAAAQVAAAQSARPQAHSAQIGPPPVVLDLGPVKPTPAPTPRRADKKRFVSTVTAQNSADGETVISFEVMDVADEGNEKYPLIAAKSYSLNDAEATTQAEARAIAERIVTQIRQLEREMLHFAEVVGPPKEREPLVK